MSDDYEDSRLPDTNVWSVSLRLQEFNAGDAHSLTPPQLYRSLSRMMYERRSKVDPLWNSLVLAGVDRTTGVPFLGYVDLLGTTYQSSTIATGFGLHLAQPLLRKAVEGREDVIEEAEATEILESCMKVLCEWMMVVPFDARRFSLCARQSTVMREV